MDAVVKLGPGVVDGEVVFKIQVGLGVVDAARKHLHRVGEDGPVDAAVLVFVPDPDEAHVDVLRMLDGP